MIYLFMAILGLALGLFILWAVSKPQSGSAKDLARFVGASADGLALGEEVLCQGAHYLRCLNPYFASTSNRGLPLTGDYIVLTNYRLLYFYQGNQAAEQAQFKGALVLATEAANWSDKAHWLGRSCDWLHMDTKRLTWENGVLGLHWLARHEPVTAKSWREAYAPNRSDQACIETINYNGHSYQTDFRRYEAVVFDLDLALFKRWQTHISGS